MVALADVSQHLSENREIYTELTRAICIFTSAVVVFKNGGHLFNPF